MRWCVVFCEGFEPVQHHGAKCQRFAGAGSGLPDQIRASQREGDGECLDGKWLDDALGGERLCDGLGDAEIQECVVCCLLSQGSTSCSNNVVR